MNFRLINDDVKAKAASALMQTPISDPPIEIVFRPYKSKRTIAQNSKFHAMIRDIADSDGEHPDRMKAIVLIELGYYKLEEISGKDVCHLAKTHKMNVGQLSALIERVYEYAAGHGVVLE